MSGDGMDHLRIPFENIKFGHKLEVQGYGTVFDGEFDGQRVALKQLNITNLGNVKPKLLGEILTISQFRDHPNVVALLGFCDEKSNEIILVYEYVGSGNLEEKMRKRLNTIQRLEISLDAARGLDYLHTGIDQSTPGIVHGNVKPSKILLNSVPNSKRFEAKVSSFGLSKVVPGQSRKNLEPVDPETKESDVYSFGVVLLEVLCGVSELVDTDDYQERHVTELVPKKMEQDKLRKIVHFDIRKEIKTEALETYAKIACECVVENPEARPTMARVVEELEKALILQGGEVSYAQIVSSRNTAKAPNESVVEDAPKDEGNGVMVDSDKRVNKLEEVKNLTIEEDVKDVIVDDKLDVAGDDKGDEVSIDGTTSEITIVENTLAEDTSLEESHVPIVDNVNGESAPENITQTEDAQDESGNDDSMKTEEIKDDINSKEESTITDENEDDNQTKTEIEESVKEISNNLEMNSNDRETTEEFIDDFNSIEKSNINDESKDDNQSTEITVSSESSNVNTSIPVHLTNNEVENTVIPESGSRNFDNLPHEIHKDKVGDELDKLRIPFDKIKFGKKIDVRGYGSLFEGEYDNQQVALKRLNITNLGNIKPKLLAEILTVTRFRKHPNVVALIGFCDEKSNEIILVYEYVTSGNLADKMSKHLTIIQRLEISLDAARGLDYLHTGVDQSTPGIVHGHIKLSKIVLNSDSNSSRFKAKVSGFGLSRLLPGHVQIAPRSIDPMYEITGKMMKESDVYAFGVLLLEVLCGVPELVDTDDYQERHVTELVPKRLEQNMLRKIVHFDIRDEIKTEALETYARIACRCVMKNHEERPTMTEVVIELQKALKLQGGEVSDVHILGSSIGNGQREGTVDDDDQHGDDKTEEDYKVCEETILEDETDNTSKVVEETIVSDEKEEDSKAVEETVAADETEEGSKEVQETIVADQTEEESKEVGETIDDETQEESKEVEEILLMQEEQSSHVPILESIDSESSPDNTTRTEDAQDGSSKNDLLTTEEIIDIINSKEESTITVEKDDNQTKTEMESVKAISNNLEMRNHDRETTEEFIDDFNSIGKSNINVESKDDNQGTEIVVSSESSNGDTSISDHLTNNEVENTVILESGSRNFDNLPHESHDDEDRDELEKLQIPFDKIKFGKKIDVHGYGSLFEGEYDNQQVALKRLNITNLGNIKPKLLAEILTVARFRKHPNVVALIGFCDEKSNEIILVYEYVTSGNLADKMSKHLNTIQRLEICLDAACGLDYLHTGVDQSTPGIVHGHIKLSKILLNLDSNSSRFKAKVSGFGLSRLLPGHVQIAPRSIDPMYEITGKLMMESDVYTFGVLLLEVLCGIPELVDTDDYQERHVTELVPKRLEQNLLRKIVHFDIRDEIKTEALETYARIACRCVMKNHEERPTMFEVIRELEKALILQGGEVSYVNILGSSTGNGLREGTVDDDDQQGDDKTEGKSKVVEETSVDDKTEVESKVVEETIVTNENEEESKAVEETIVTNETEEESKVVEETIEEIEDTKKENGESKEENAVDMQSNEKPGIIAGNEVDKDSVIPTSEESYNGDNGKSTKLLHSFHRLVLDSEDADNVAGKTDSEDAKINNDNTDDQESKEEITGNKITPKEITMDSTSPDSGDMNAGKHIALLKTEKKPELVVHVRGDFDDFSTNENITSVAKPEVSESKRSNSTCSESSNGDGTTPTDFLLQKSPANTTTTKKTLTSSGNCCCSWLSFICDRIVFYGGQFWNKLVSCFT